MVLSRFEWHNPVSWKNSSYPPPRGPSSSLIVHAFANKEVKKHYPNFKFTSHFMRNTSDLKLKLLFLFSYIFIYYIKNLQDKLPIALRTNYTTKHYKDDNTYLFLIWGTLLY